MDANWTGQTGGYLIASNQLDVGVGGDIFWGATSYGPDQEVFVTYVTVDPAGGEVDLLLKSQSPTTWTAGTIAVWYRAQAGVVEVWTYSPAQGWALYGDGIPVTLVDGDQFGARARSNGQVLVYRNGVLLATRDTSAWNYTTVGGYVGLWYDLASQTLLDAFGGGTIP
jgi:hypothetical protein